MPTALFSTDHTTLIVSVQKSNGALRVVTNGRGADPPSSPVGRGAPVAGRLRVACQQEGQASIAEVAAGRIVVPLPAVIAPQKVGFPLQGVREFALQCRHGCLIKGPPSARLRARMIQE